jgi:hypothetical protein
MCKYMGHNIIFKCLQNNHILLFSDLSIANLFKVLPGMYLFLSQCRDLNDGGCVFPGCEFINY